jgi:hypothetical protein
MAMVIVKDVETKNIIMSDNDFVTSQWKLNKNKYVPLSKKEMDSLKIKEPSIRVSNNVDDNMSEDERLEDGESTDRAGE